MRSVMVASGNFFFRYRDFLFPVVFACLAALLMPTYPRNDQHLDYVVDAIGIGIALTGQALRASVIGFAYVKRGGKDKRVYADTLVQEGFFAHSRNPLYVGNLLVLLGLIVVHGSPWFLLIGGAFYLYAYMSITLAEENFLGGKFGEQYVEYCRRVPRFWIRFKGLGESLKGMTFDWKRVVRKEYGSTFSWMFSVLALLVYEQYRHFGYEASKKRVVAVLAVFALLLVAYAAARISKKTGRLGHD